jgi:hypothetical protein
MTRLLKFSIRNWQNRFIFLRNCILTYYEHKPQVSLENDYHKLYWDRSLLMDKAVPFSWPDITLVDETKKEAAFIGIAIPLTHNIQATTAEKQSKYYKDLVFETNQQWQLNKIIVIPLVLSAMGSSLKCLIKALPSSIYSHTYCPRSRKWCN